VVTEVKLVPQVCQVLQDPQELRANLDLLEAREQLASQVVLDLKDKEESKVHRDNKEHRETEDNRDHLDQQDPVGSLVALDPVVGQDREVKPASQVLQGLLDRLVPWGLQEDQGLLGL